VGVDAAEVIAQPVDIPEIVTTNTTTGHWGSNNSGGNQSSTIAPLVASSKAHTKHNQLISAIKSSSDSTSTAFATFLQPCQMTEQFEWRQCCMDCEEERARHGEECARHEEELHEMRRKESRWQEMVMQMAITGMMAYLGAKKPRDCDGQEPPVA